MKKILILLAAILAAAACGGPVRKTARGFKAEGALSRFDVICYAPDIIQVVKSPLYGHVDPTPTASVVLRPQKVDFDFRVGEDGKPCLVTDSLRVELDIAAGTFSFYRADGSLLVREQPEAVSHEEIHRDSCWRTARRCTVSASTGGAGWTSAENGTISRMSTWRLPSPSSTP